MTGEVEVVAWRVSPPADDHYGTGSDTLSFFELSDDDLKAGYTQQPLVPASALEALRADNERLEHELAQVRGELRRESSARDFAEASLAGRDAEIAKAVAEAYEDAAKVMETRAEYFDRAPGHRDWKDAARSYRASANELRDTAPRARAQEPRS
jgi:hypothetical protein